MNWLILIPFGIAMIALIVFLVKRNQKDEEEFEHNIKDDYPKPKGHNNDIEVEDKTK